MSQDLKTFISQLETSAHGQINIVSGVSWMDSAENSSLKEFIKSNKVSKPATIEIKRHDETIQNGVVSLKGVKSKQVLISAAQLISSYQQHESQLGQDSEASKCTTWIAVEKLGSGYWVCLIEDGIVFSETKANLTSEQAQKEGEQLSEWAKSQDQKFCFIGDAMTEFDSSAIVEVSLRIILEGLSSSELKSYQLNANSTQDLIGIGLMVIAVSFLGYQAASMLGLLNFEPTPEELRQKQEAESTAVVRQYYDNFYSRPSLNESLGYVSGVIEAKQLFDAPWPIHILNCQIEVNSCQVTYKNPNNLSTKYIKSFFENRCLSFDITPQGAAANCSFSILTISPAYSNADESIFELTEHLIGYAKIGFNTELSNPSPSTVAGGEYAPAHELKKEGAWKISGSYIDALSIERYSKNITWVKPRTLQISVNKGVTEMKIEGSYVVQ